jgi:3-oxoacyl-[acyl-carrier protein] reductase
MKSLAIFGASRGIGLSFANSVIDDYDQIYLFDISDNIYAVRDNIRSTSNKKCDAYVLDVTNVEQMGKCFTKIFNEQSIDNLCYFIRSKNKPHFTSITPQEWDQEFNVTLKGAFFVVQKILPYLKAKASIVFISSICAQLISTETVSYHAAKAGIENLTKYLAKHLRDEIRVNAVRLGFIVQDEHAERFYSDENSEFRSLAISCHPVGRVGDVQDVFSSILFLFDSSSSFITGHTLNVDGGLSLSEQSSMMMENFHEK